MAKSVLKVKADHVRQASAAYTELYNDNGLQVYACKAGKFELKCGSTHKYAHSLQELAASIDALDLHDFPSSGNEVVSNIKEQLGKQYRLEIHAATAGKDEVIHTVEGSLDVIADGLTAVASADVPKMAAGVRYAMPQNMYGGDYMMLVPMNTDVLELSPSFAEPQLYEKQQFAKGQLLHGICPITHEVVTIIVTDAYPNGTLKDQAGKIYTEDEIARLQFAIGKDSIEAEPDFHEPDESFYEATDVPTYNPVGVVKEQAPILGSLKNYDSILNASAGVLSDFMHTCRGSAYLDRSSLNKVTVTAVNADGQATDGQVEWNVRIGSPAYKRSSNIVVPLMMTAGNIDLGREFITSTGAKFPLTAEGLKAHLGAEVEDDGFRHAGLKERQASTVHADKDVDALLNGVGSKKTAGGESYSDVLMQQQAIEASETKEEAVQKLKDMGYESTFTEDMNSDKVETIEECVDRVWDLYKDPAWKEGSKKTAYTEDQSDVTPVAEEVMSIDRNVWAKQGWQEGADVDMDVLKSALTTIAKDVTAKDFDVLEDYNFHSAYKAIKELQEEQGITVEGSTKTAAYVLVNFTYKPDGEQIVNFISDNHKQVKSVDKAKKFETEDQAKAEAQQNEQAFPVDYFKAGAQEKTAAGLRERQVQMIADSAVSNLLMYADEIRNGEMTWKTRAEEIFDASAFEGYPQFSKLNIDQIEAKISNGLADAGVLASEVYEVLRVFEAACAKYNKKGMKEIETHANKSKVKATKKVGSLILGIVAVEAFDEPAQLANLLKPLGKPSNFEAASEDESIIEGSVTVETYEQALAVAQALDDTGKDVVIDGISRDNWGLFAENHGSDSNVEFVTEALGGDKVRATKKLAAEEPSAGFAIDTSAEDMIKENAREKNITLTDADWKNINEDVQVLETNAMRILEEKYGIHCRAEGHGSDDALIGTCWPVEGREQAVREYWTARDIDNDPADRGLFYEAHLYDGVSDIGKELLDVHVTFFDIEPKPVDPDTTSSKTSSVIPEELQEVRENADEYGLTEDQIQAMTDEELELFLEEHMSLASAEPMSQRTDIRTDADRQNDVSATKKLAVKPGHAFQTEAVPGKYYTGTFTDWSNGGIATPFAAANADEIPPSAKDIKTVEAPSVAEALKTVKTGASVPDQHQLRILKDTVKNPAKGLLGGPSAEEAEKILRQKFNYSDSQIEGLKASKKIGAFMQPTVEKGTYIIVDGPMGGETISKDYVSDEELAKLQADIAANDEASLKGMDCAMYFENKKIFDIEVATGYVAYFSAPGYMDRTENTFFDTEEQARAYLKNEEDGAGAWDTDEDEAVEAAKLAAKVKTAGVAIIYEIDKMVQQDSVEEGATGKTTDFGVIDDGIAWTAEELFKDVEAVTGIPKADWTVFEDGRLTSNINEDAEGNPIKADADGLRAKELADAGKLYLADYSVMIKLGDGTEPTAEQLATMLGISQY